MSAFLVSWRHIALLVEAAYRYEVPLAEGFTPDTLGQELWRENVRSLNYCYGERQRAPRYQHDSTAVRPLVRNPCWVYKQVRCYAYQACERPDFERSRAARVVEELTAALCQTSGQAESQMRESPEWDSAPWGID